MSGNKEDKITLKVKIKKFAKKALIWGIIWYPIHGAIVLNHPMQTRRLLDKINLCFASIKEGVRSVR